MVSNQQRLRLKILGVFIGCCGGSDRASARPTIRVYSASLGSMNHSHGLNVCPAWFAWAINNPLRRWLHKPGEMFAGLVAPGFVVLETGCGSGPFTTALAD